MKNYLKTALVIFLTVALTDLNAQLKTGYIFGVNLSTMTMKINGQDIETEKQTGVNFGGKIEIPLFGHFTFQPACIFTAKGADYTIDTLDYSLSPVYVEIPANVVYTFGSDAVKISVMAGPYFACGIGGYKIVSGEELKYLKFGSGRADNELKFFDIGLNLGAGINIKGLLISAQYEIGLSNISAMTDDDSEIKNNVIGISISSVFPVK